MERYYISVLVVIFVIVAVGGTHTIIKSSAQEQTAQEQTAQDSPGMYSSWQVPMDTLDDIVENADYIIIGEVVQVDEYNDTTCECQVAVDHQYKGKKTFTKINVYSQRDVMKQGKKYMLFLEYFESTNLPGPIFCSTAGPQAIIELTDKNEINSIAKFTKGKTKNELINSVKNSLKLHISHERDFEIKQAARDLGELESESNFISCIIPTTVLEENKYLKLVEFGVVKDYKGSLETDSPIFLPANVEVGQKYLVFFKQNSKGSLTITAREGSVIAESETDQWNKTKSHLCQLKQDETK